MKQLFEELENYGHSDYYPFHMPGHKRQIPGEFLGDVYEYDITEIEGFDNLHDAQGMIKEAQQRAARLYCSEETHFLVNGSTCGILAAIFAAVNKGNKILIGRNCHKAAYNAIYLNELTPIYIYPEIMKEFDLCTSISIDKIGNALNANPEIQAVMLTSPSYDGIVSDIERIAELVHQHGKPLIVDEAHGAHFGFSKGFPKSAVAYGADLVIQSVHKTLPSLTQTALLHVNGELVDRNRLRRYLSIFQSSSPSYILMAGIDQCMNILEKEGKYRFDLFEDKLQKFYERVRNLQHLHVVTKKEVHCLGAVDFDRGKLIISTKKTDMTGKELYEKLLKHYHIQAEMAAGSYCLLIATIMDTEEGFARLLQALFEIDAEIHLMEKRKLPEDIVICRNQIVMRADQALDYNRKSVRIEESIGKIAADYVFLYPPGIPLIVPGEEISQEFAEQILRYQKQGLCICGLVSGKKKEINVIWEKSTIS